jgi:hypothetical protein
MKNFKLYWIPITFVLCGIFVYLGYKYDFMNWLAIGIFEILGITMIALFIIGLINGIRSFKNK